MADRDAKLLLTGLAIVAAFGVVGLIAGALAQGSAGLGALIGAGAGVVVAVGFLAAGVMRRL